MRRLLTLAAVAAAVMALPGCGQYHLGGSPRSLVTRDALPLGAPRLAPSLAIGADPSAAALFPLVEGQLFAYERLVDRQVVGQRTMAVGQVKTSTDPARSEASLQCRLTAKAGAATQVYGGRVTVGGGDVVADLASPDAETLGGFALQGTLNRGKLWTATVGSTVWTCIARDVERIGVPAGTYACVPVEATSRTGNAVAWRQVRQVLHFAPNVGLVKVQVTVEERTETASTSRQATEQLVAIKTAN